MFFSNHPTFYFFAKGCLIARRYALDLDNP
jgi:hypothetical protein